MKLLNTCALTFAIALLTTQVIKPAVPFIDVKSTPGSVWSSTRPRSPSPERIHRALVVAAAAQNVTPPDGPSINHILAIPSCGPVKQVMCSDLPQQGIPAQGIPVHIQDGRPTPLPLLAAAAPEEQALIPAQQVMIENPIENKDGERRILGCRPENCAIGVLCSIFIGAVGVTCYAFCSQPCPDSSCTELIGKSCIQEQCVSKFCLKKCVSICSELNNFTTLFKEKNS